jgi:beta propeller repeat protein
MRRIALLPLAVLVLAACHDQATGPTGPDAEVETLALAKLKTSGAAPITLFPGPERTVAVTTGGDVFRYPNRPLPDLGGGRVVWRSLDDPYWGPTQVHDVDLATGAQRHLATVHAYAAPQTSGRYTLWQEDGTGMTLLDNATGERRRIEATSPASLSAKIAGDRIAFMDYGSNEIVVYDIATGQRRTIATWGQGSDYYHVRDIGFDGRYVALISDGGMGVSGLGLAVHDTWTGAVRVAVPFGQGRMTGPSVDAGRVVYSLAEGGRHGIYLYDVASGQTRRLTDSPRSQEYPEISGDLVVWEDTRQETNPAYVFNYDVYLYDLRAEVELPLATSATWSGTPRVDGTRVIWTERRGDRWEVVLVELTPASIEGLRQQLRAALGTGTGRSSGIVRSLEVFLSRAAAAQAAGDRSRAEAALRQFAAHVHQHAGKQIDAAVAARLEGMAMGVIARL